MYDDHDKVTQCCVLSRPWIKFQLRNLGFDDVAAGVPNGSWEHFNHRRLLHAQEPRHVSQQIKLTPDMTIMLLFYEVAWYHMHATY